jgi:hypothetical protein
MNEALEWWNSMSLEMKFYKTIEYNYLLEGDRVDNHPDNLSKEDIKKIFIEDMR